MQLVQISQEIQEHCYRIIGICMQIHSEVGPGFPEEYYQKALEIELSEHNITFEPQHPVSVLYKEYQLGLNYLDFLC